MRWPLDWMNVGSHLDPLNRRNGLDGRLVTATLMGRFAWWCAMSMLLLAAPSVSGQIVNPSATIDCSPDQMRIDVGPGASRTTTATCTVDNPTVYTEEVSIEVTVNGFSSAAPESVNVPPGSDASFEIIFAADPGTPMANFDAEVVASVSSFNGVPCQWCGEDNDSFVISVEQYAEWSMTVQTQFVTIPAEGDSTVLIEVENRGNGPDGYSIEILNRSGLEEAGLTFQLSGGSGAALQTDGRETVSVDVNASSNIATRDWEIRFRIQSDFDSSYRIEEVFNLDTTEKPQSAVAIESLPAWAIPAAGVGTSLVLIMIVAVILSRRLAGDDDFSDYALDDLEDDLRGAL